MKNILIKEMKQYNLLLLMIIILTVSCEPDLEVGLPKSQLIGESVFKEINTARAAVIQIYADMRDGAPFTGELQGLNSLMGMYADELDYYGNFGGTFDVFYRHNVTGSNLNISELWDQAYKIIYKCNAVIEGLEASRLPEEDTQPLIGEVLFLRTMAHASLTNLFGKIPYITSTNYEVNARVSRIPEEEVYNLMIADIYSAIEKLSVSEQSGKKIFASKGTAEFLMARIQLYHKNWEKAEEFATRVLSNGAYQWNADLTTEFLSTGTGIVWQLQPAPGTVASEARVFVFVNGPPPSVALSPELVASFEPDDLRLSNWIGNVTNENGTWYYPHKYKTRTPGSGPEEYSVLMRLAEAYLIRAEANANLGRFQEAVQDINRIRTRAGLDDITANGYDEIMNAIQKERLHELFSEQGHRWFDLKRWNLAKAILQPIKEGWRDTDILLPLPENELMLNPNLKPQNPGY